MQSTKTQIGILARGIVMLAAVFVLLTAYYWAHKPFDTQTFLRLGGAALDLFTVSLLFAIAGGIGRKVLAFIGRRLVFDFRLLSRAEHFALETTFGLMLISVGALALGMIGLFRSIFFWVPLLVLALLLRQEVGAWLKEGRALIAAARPQSRWSWLLAAFTVLMLVLALLHSLAPPYAWDGMTYHLVGPQRYLAAGRMTADPYNFYVGFPKSMEMLFSVAISLFGRDTAAAPVHFGFALIGFLAVAGLARRCAHNGNNAAWLSVALLIGCFSVWLIMGWPYVDLTVMALGALAFSLANVWRETKNERWLILLGLVCGFALGVKYTAGLLVIPLGLYILICQSKYWFRNGVIFGLAVAVAFLPWMIRGWLHYGNPVYPYFFNGLNWDAGRAELFNQYNRGFTSLNRTWQLFLMPLSATIFGINDGDTFAFTLNPWLFTLPFFLPLAWSWLEKRARRLCLSGALLAVPIFVFWAVSAAYAGIAMQTRLMIMLFPIGAVMGALALDAFSQMPEKPVNFTFLLRAFVAITLFASALEAFNRLTWSRVGSYLLGQTSESEYLFQHLATYPATMMQLGELPDGAQVRLLWEPRAYYCPANVTCIPDVMFDLWSGALTPDQTAADVLRRWHEEGDDYILFFHLGYEAYMNYTYRYDEDVILPESLESSLIRLWTTADGRYTLYTWAEDED
jgi:hypothetical protein